MGKQPVREHDYLYWEWALWNWGENTEVPGGMMQGLRKGDWKIARQRNDQPWELYNLADDVGETKDLANQHPEILKRLAALADEARIPMRPQQEPDHPAGQTFN